MRIDGRGGCNAQPVPYFDVQSVQGLCKNCLSSIARGTIDTAKGTCGDQRFKKLLLCHVASRHHLCIPREPYTVRFIVGLIPYEPLVRWVRHAAHAGNDQSQADSRLTQRRRLLSFQLRPGGIGNLSYSPCFGEAVSDRCTAYSLLPCSK